MGETPKASFIFFPMPLSKPDVDAPGSLYEATLKLVNKDPKGLLSVQVRTGVPLYWLRKFAADKIPKPNVNRMQLIFEKLSGRKIRL